MASTSSADRPCRIKARLATGYPLIASAASTSGLPAMGPPINPADSRQNRWRLSRQYSGLRVASSRSRSSRKLKWTACISASTALRKLISGRGSMVKAQ